MTLVAVTQFTDPYCTWCWGAEPVRRRLAEVYRDQIEFEFVMGGLAEDFEQFSDPVDDVDGDEMGPHWLSAAQRHGMPVDVSLWDDDPPSSTYPACVAYEAATFQGRDLARAYLRRLREAGAAEARNLERTATLVELADDVGLNAGQFRTDVDSERAREAFQSDLRTARQHGATSLPTYLVELGGERELLRGYRPFVTFEKLFTEAAVDLDEHEPRPVAELVASYGRMATQEVAEVRGVSREVAAADLRELADAGEVRAVEAGTDYFWEPA